MLLQGLKVVEFATYIAAPGAGAMLCEWGAEVIKVEPPAGDPMRQFFDSIGVDSGGNPVFDLDNRGKQGVVLDIAKPEGREALVKLAGWADVFLTNVRPASLKRAGLDPDTLRALYPQLIYASVTGYGLEGAEADRAGFDIAAYWARSGVGGLTAPKGVAPFPNRTGFGDHACSVATTAAILAAVVERQRTGVGRLVETSLLRAGTHAVSTDLAIQLRFGRIASTRPREQAVNPLGNFFQAGDGKWFTIVPRQGNSDWPRLCRAIDRPDLIEDARFAKSRARRENGAELVALLDGAFGRRPLAEVAAALDREDVVWAPVQTLAEVAADPQAEAAGCFVEVPDGRGGTQRAPALPARFPGADTTPRAPAPSLGEHTDTVLAALGYTPDAVAALKAAGAAA